MYVQDNESEALVTAALRKIIYSENTSEVNGEAAAHEHQRATMIIAHRLSTIQQCSKIVVVVRLNENSNFLISSPPSHLIASASLCIYVISCICAGKWTSSRAREP